MSIQRGTYSSGDGFFTDGHDVLLGIRPSTDVRPPQVTTGGALLPHATLRLLCALPGPRGAAPSGGSGGEAPTTGRVGGHNTVRRGGAAPAPSREAQPRAVRPPTTDRARNELPNTTIERS